MNKHLIPAGIPQKPVLKHYVFLIGRFHQVVVIDFFEATARLQVEAKYSKFSIQLLRVV